MLAPTSFGTLDNKEGVAETCVFCTPCHGEQIVSQQRLSDEDWKTVVRVMEEAHGMASISGTDANAHPEYLANACGWQDRPFK